MNLGEFTQLAPFLGNPLVLVGFVLFLLFGVHRLLIKSKIIPPVPQSAAPAIVKMILRYGFWVALLIIVLGFIYAYAQLGVSGWVKATSGRNADVRLVDTYVEDEGRTINVKLQNNGNGSALIYEVRLLFYRGAGMVPMFMPLYETIVHFPMTARFRDKLSTILKGRTVSQPTMSESNVPDDLKNIPIALRKPINERDPLFSDIKIEQQPEALSDPLKISETIPPGGAEWLKVRITVERDRSEIIANSAVESHPAHLVIYYDRSDKIVTPVFFMKLDPRSESN
jgi:hypothetical protein